MVKKSSPLWDRNSNTYPNKSSKNQLWEHISSTLHRDVNSCMLRWKALREKYIRQKAKFQEGEAKWELLDDLGFLDKVIQYRRKQNDFVMNHNNAPTTNNSKYSNKHQPDNFSGYQDNSNYSYIRCNADVDDYGYTDSSNDFLNIVKEENTVQQADSSFNSPTSSNKRLRDNSVGSYGDSVSEKRVRSEEKPVNSKIPVDKESAPNEKTPEQLFGDLVASLLSKKPENQRNLFMIEIMTVLSK